MKTILVPTDFSENAGNALDYAIGIAKGCGARIVLVHGYFSVFVSPGIPPESLLKQINENKLNAESQLKHLAEKVELKKIACEIVNKEEIAIELILDTAEKMKPDLIVMGTKGASGISDEFFGTNTAAVLKKTTCPLMTVPAGTVYQPAKNIIYATGYNRRDIEALIKIVDIMRFSDPRISLVHISEAGSGEENKEENMETFKTMVESELNYKKLDYRVEDGEDVYEAFERIVESESPELFAMTTYNRNLFDRLFGASSSRKMAYHTKIPLMTVHFGERPVSLFE